MTDLLEARYLYLQSNKLSTYYAAPAYRTRRHRMADREKALREPLSPSVLPVLDALPEDAEDVSRYEQEALFQAALSLGLELSRV